MASTHIEQRYWRHQFLRFISSLLVLLSLIPFVFLLTMTGVSDRVEHPRLLDSSEMFYISIATALLLAALVLGRISIRRLSYREIRNPENRERLQDEHERSIRYRAGFRALWIVVFLQAILYTWVMLTSFGLPTLPPGLSQVATMIVAHLAFWLPYLQQTK